MSAINYKKIIGLLGVVIAIVIGFNMVTVENKIFEKTNIVQAEDEENEEEDEEDDDDEREVIDTSADNATAKETETKVIYTKLSDTVSTVTTTITRHDSDGDGLYDDEDPHPSINENFIVGDGNLNGIDDRYEQ